jgi:vacuolar protein sorting-associated protein 13A/C
MSGLVNKPLEGAREDGVLGMIKGGAKGVVGVFSKTISGGIDIIAKTSEGLDYQSKSKF